VAAARRNSSASTIIGITVILLFAAGLTVYFLAPATAPSPAAAAPGPPAGVQTFPNLPRNHVPGHVNYPQNPPVGGEHSTQWLTCGIYPTPVPNENAVHSMEHGAVWITYRPDLPTPDLTTLRTATHGQPYTLLSPYPGLPTPVVATAWGVQLRLPTASDPRLAQFLGFYQRGPQTPEPGAPCAGGIGQPER
jgi:hypothetical protein